MVSKYYWAGFIDGEGCFNVAKDHKSFIPRLLIGNTNLEILELFKKQYGGNIGINKSKVYNAKIFYMYRASFNPLRKILKDIYPLLILKKPQATLVLEMLDNRNRDFRIDAKAKMHILNKKGLN